MICQNSRWLLPISSASSQSKFTEVVHDDRGSSKRVQATVAPTSVKGGCPGSFSNVVLFACTDHDNESIRLRSWVPPPTALNELIVPRSVETPLSRNWVAATS